MELHLAVCLPLHLMRLPVTEVSANDRRGGTGGTTVTKLFCLRAFWLLAGSYMLNAVVFSDVGHLVPLFQSRGFTPGDAAWIAACAGPMQVFGRIVEFKFGHRWTGSQTGVAALTLVVPALVGFAVWPMPSAY